MKTKRQIEEKLDRINSLINGDLEGIYIPYTKRRGLHLQRDILIWVLNEEKEKSLEVKKRIYLSFGSSQMKILKLLEENNSGLTAYKISEVLGNNIMTIKKAVTSLIKEKKIISKGRGVRGEPKRYFLK